MNDLTDIILLLSFGTIAVLVVLALRLHEKRLEMLIKRRKRMNFIDKALAYKQGQKDLLNSIEAHLMILSGINYYFSISKRYWNKLKKKYEK